MDDEKNFDPFSKNSGLKNAEKVVTGEKHLRYEPKFTVSDKVNRSINQSSKSLFEYFIFI